MSNIPNFSIPPPSMAVASSFNLPPPNPSLGPPPPLQAYLNDPSHVSNPYNQFSNSSARSWETNPSPVSFDHQNNYAAPNHYYENTSNNYQNFEPNSVVYPPSVIDQLSLPPPHMVNVNLPPPTGVDVLRPPPTFRHSSQPLTNRRKSPNSHSYKLREGSYTPSNSRIRDSRHSRSSVDYDSYKSKRDSSVRSDDFGKRTSVGLKEYDDRYKKDRQNEYNSRGQSRNQSEYRSSSSRSHRDSRSNSKRPDNRDRHSHSSHPQRQHKSSSVRSSNRIEDRHVRSLRSVEPSLKRSSTSRSKCEESSSDKKGDEDKKKKDDFCSNMDEVYENMEKNLADQSEDDELSKRWYRSSPADLYYAAVEGRRNVIESTPRGRKLAENMKKLLIDRGRNARPVAGAESLAPPRPHRPRLCKHKSEQLSSSGSSSSSESDEADHAMQELERKQQHPRRLHPEMWYNDPGDMNDGPLCRCSARTRRQGIRHGVYAGEVRPPPCDPHSNNADKLYHYRVTISPPTNFLIKTLTVITHDEHEFLFSGFSMLSHYPLTKLPTCKVIRFNIEYTILYLEEQPPLNYTVEELELFEEFLFCEILELVDLDMGSRDADGCSQFHLLPRWERSIDGGGGEVLAVAEVIRHLINAGGPLLPDYALPALRAANQREWQTFVDGVRGMIVTYPGKKPCSVRVDQLDRSLAEEEVKHDSKQPRTSQETTPVNTDLIYPEIVHFGIRPPQLSYAGNPEYKKAWRDYVKFRHLAANMPKPSYEDKRKLEAKEAKLQEMRTQSKMKRDVTVAVSAEGFYRTGLMCDVVQHAMLIPVLISHLRFHNSLNNLEKTIDYKFENRSLLQLALTHPSYRENFGTNPDHARNSLTNCGIRQPEYGDRRIHYLNIRKRGINTLINIMSRFGKKKETESAINHNERLEFLGDAVVEFLSSIHLFKMFPSLEEGGLATYRAAIVQNQHLAQLAKKLGLDQYMLYAHGSDLCHDLELRHAMANCFEALMGALFLDGGIDVADRVFGLALWKDSPELLESWRRPRPHPLQEQEPLGDRRWVEQYPFLQKLTKFEDSIGVEFKHIRLLARAFTDRSMGFTNLTLGSNQRLEFLGDTVLQLISSDHLYKHFPEHHEGHLSLLRSSLVNNRTQAVVCDDLAMASYAVYHNPKAGPKTKDKADLLEAFLGALYIDKNIEHCLAFCSVCLFPRLREFIMNQEWNDPKSKLQQCCLTLRTMDGSEPDIPIYKVIECVGPTNTRVYSVAVYFRGERLASARGHCIQEAEMNAAKQAISNSQNLFPQLDHQKRVIAKSMKHQKKKNYKGRNVTKEVPDKRSRRRRGSRSASRSSNCSRRRSSGSESKSAVKRFASRSSRDKDKLPMAYRTDKSRYSDNDSLVGISSASEIYSSSDSEIAVDEQDQNKEMSEESKSP